MAKWTVPTLYEHFTQRFSDSDKAVQAALEAAEKAVIKAEAAADKRFDATNEFRGQLADQSATFMTKVEADLRFKALTDTRQKAQALWVPAVLAIASLGVNVLLGVLLVLKK